MRRWLAFVILAGTFAVPFAAQAQNPIKLSTLQVQLWPEYDQPSMLVIYDFKLPEGVKLPVSVSMSFPKEAHLVAVASQSSNGSLLNTDYIGPIASENVADRDDTDPDARHLSPRILSAHVPDRE